MTRKFALSLLTVAALSACASYDAPQNSRQWIFNADGGEARLAYGTPQSDDAPLMMSCRSGGRVSISQNQLQPGDGVTLESGPARTTFHGEAEPDQLNGGTIVTADAAVTSPVLQAFRRSGRLAMVENGRTARLPASPAERAQIQRFFEVCQA